MEWTLESILIQATLVIATVAGLLYSYITRHYDYWRQKDVPYAIPSFPFGNSKDLLLARTNVCRYYEKFYKMFKSNKYGGTYEFDNPTLIVTDLDIVKQIMTKDSMYFMDCPLPPKSADDFLAMEEKLLEEIGARFTPTFVSEKMRQLYTLIEKCSDQLKRHLEHVTLHNETVEVKDIMVHFTRDVIATCVFGSEVIDSNTDAFKYSQLIVEQSKWTVIKYFFMINFPRIANFLCMSKADDNIRDFIRKLIETKVKYRDENNFSQIYFMDLLTTVKNYDDDRVTNNHRSIGGKSLEKEMAAQMFMFFAASFQTAASATTFTLYELARNPEIQEKLRQEIEKILKNHGGKITFQALQELTCVEQVLYETVRLYGSAPVLIRRCAEPYKIPDTNITVDKNIKVAIPSYAIHHDPEIYPEPFKFDPERFSEQNIGSRHHYSFLPFGEGPRVCIGMIFGKMQIKSVLSTIVTNYTLSLMPDTPVPIESSSKSLMTASAHPIKLRFSRRTS